MTLYNFWNSMFYILIVNSTDDNANPLAQIIVYLNNIWKEEQCSIEECQCGDPCEHSATLCPFEFNEELYLS